MVGYIPSSIYVHSGQDANAMIAKRNPRMPLLPGTIGLSYSRVARTPLFFGYRPRNVATGIYCRMADMERSYKVLRAMMIEAFCDIKTPTFPFLSFPIPTNSSISFSKQTQCSKKSSRTPLRRPSSSWWASGRRLRLLQPRRL